MFLLNPHYKLYAKIKVVFILWWGPFLFIKKIIEIYQKQLLSKLSNSFNVIFSFFKVGECSLTYGNPPTKKVWLDISNYMEVDKKSDFSKSSDLSESSDLGSNKDNPKSDDESKSNDE